MSSPWSLEDYARQLPEALQESLHTRLSVYPVRNNSSPIYDPQPITSAREALSPSQNTHKRADDTRGVIITRPMAITVNIVPNRTNDDAPEDPSKKTYIKFITRRAGPPQFRPCSRAWLFFELTSLCITAYGK